MSAIGAATARVARVRTLTFRILTWDPPKSRQSIDSLHNGPYHLFNPGGAPGVSCDIKQSSLVTFPTKNNLDGSHIQVSSWACTTISCKALYLSFWHWPGRLMLRSNTFDRQQLILPRTKTITIGQRRFSLQVPTHGTVYLSKYATIVYHCQLSGNF